MLATIAHEDQILINAKHKPAARRVTIHSHNDAYPDWPDCDPTAIRIIGRVVWA